MRICHFVASLILKSNTFDVFCQLYENTRMMLEQWRRSKGMSYAKLAKLLGAQHATMVRRWCRPFGAEDKVIPTVKYMERILAVTNGTVTPNDFYIRRN